VDEELNRLIRDAKRGDKDAFTKLISLYKAPVYRHAFGMLGDKMEAEDAAQEAFIKAYSFISRLENEYSYSAWMIRIVSNVCMDRLKKRRKERALVSESIAEARSPSTRDEHLGLTVEEAMRKLTPEHRQVILLHDVQGYRYEEIADLIGIPMGTVKSRLNAGRLALRNELKKGDE